MAKRFLYVCCGVLALVLAYAMGANQAEGQAGSFRLLSISYAAVGDKVYHLETLNPPLGWRELPYLGDDLPPVPVSSLVAFGSGLAVTDSGEGWDRTSGGWVSLGFLPGVSAVENTTWGSVKARYR
jgi:hypothetical protein